MVVLDAKGTLLMDEADEGYEELLHAALSIFRACAEVHPLPDWPVGQLASTGITHPPPNTCSPSSPRSIHPRQARARF